MVHSAYLALLKPLAVVDHDLIELDLIIITFLSTIYEYMNAQF